MNRELTLAGTKLEQYFHICAFFNSKEEEYDILGPFFKEGLDNGERALHIVNPALVNDHAENLTKHGIDCATCTANGSLKIFSWDEGHIQGGEFVKHRMLKAVDDIFEEGRKSGYPNMRIMGKMDWALKGVPGADQLIAYEAEVNEVLDRNRQPAICVYDIATLTGPMMMDILRCHPLSIVGGVLHENPFFTPPEQLLKELKEREALNS
jgi:hypothetical protein